MSKKTKKNISLLKKLTSHLNKKQLMIVTLGVILLTGTASAATIAKVSDNRAKQEQKRVLRTSNIEQATKETGKAAESKSVTSQAKPTESTAPTNSPAKTVKFVKGGASLEGSTVVVSITADSELDGSCYYSFSLGSSTVNRSNNASSRTCSINVPLSSFVKSGNWRLSVVYYSSNGQVTGGSGEIDVVIVPEVREINFAKGGAGQNGSVVVASSNLSEAQSGICTFTFSLNGSARVTKTTAISNSNKCSIEIPVSEFPKSAAYDYSLSFVSDDTLTIANQGLFEVSVE